MKFKDFKYEHLDFENLKEEYQSLLEKLKSADNPEEFMTVFNDINKFRGHIFTMISICSVRHDIDTSDEYYDTENTYWDNTSPLLQVYENEFFDIMLNCPFRNELDIPSIYFELAENARKSFDESIIEDLQEENRLSTEYGKLKASAKIELDGEVYNLASIASKISSDDRAMRKKSL